MLTGHNIPTNLLAARQVTDWSTLRQQIFKNHGNVTTYLSIKPSHVKH